MTLDERIVVEAYTGYVMTGGQDNPKENGFVPQVHRAENGPSGLDA